jgi:outer membrane protein OmpA-like peptidoglycan-associated protein
VSFEYDKHAGKDEHSSFWTSYADLFMMLSIVFLLMYVASALRSGTAGYQQQAEFRKLAQKAEGLEQQIKVYNTLKDEALQKQSSEAEQEAYQKLMNQLSLLQDEAKNEKIALRQKAKENEEKEFALNQYQRLVKGIIDANVLAKKQIVRRDEIIVTKDATIEEKKKQIQKMEATIAEDERQIRHISTRLADRIEELRQEQSRSRSSKIEMERKITALRNETERKIQDIEAKKQNVVMELTQVRDTLEQTEEQLDQAKGTIQAKDLTIQAKDQTIQAKDQTIQEKEREKGQLAAKLEADKARYAQELTGLQQEHANKLAAERAAFMDNLKKQRMSAEARARKIAEFAANAEKKAGALENQLSGLKNKIDETDGKLRAAEAEYAAAQGRLAGTQKELAGTKAALEGTQKDLEGTRSALTGTQQALEGTKQALMGTKSQLEGTKAALGQAQGDKARALAAVEGLQGDLARTRAIANARKTLAAQIAQQFSKSGIKGAVDGKTGEVTLDFGGEYFDTGSTALKPKMRTTLDRFIPIYARSLFSNPKLADKIANIEIVGFASSTFKGKYVNPKSIKSGDKEAIEYNLKLSFGRANSIFKHMLNHGNMSEQEREKLLPLMKVVGRGYLPDNVPASQIPDGMPEKEFCAKFNCKAAQRVIVKFNMKD